MTEVERTRIMTTRIVFKERTDNYWPLSVELAKRFLSTAEGFMQGACHLTGFPLKTGKCIYGCVYVSYRNRGSVHSSREKPDIRSSL
jgi:hypothetical protein